jgi:hypothetical protein
MGALMASPDLARAAQVFPNFSPMLVGLHWPSQPWGDEDVGESGSSFGPAAGKSADDILAHLTNILGDTEQIVAPLKIIIECARHNAGASTLPPEVRKAYQNLNDALGLGSQGVGGPPDADREGFDPDATGDEAENFGDFSLSGLLGPLRQLSYWTMKKRARSIGEGGIHKFLVDLQKATAAKGTRIHLMGHSFGTIVISSMIGGPNAKAPLPRPIDSVTLVQGAVSLWCYANDIPMKRGTKGYFNQIISDRKVRGPMCITQSKFDKAVGKLYPFASRVNGSAAFDATAGFPEYGAIGAFGIQGVPQNALTMLEADKPYSLAKGQIYNVESSKFICHGNGVSGAHSDIDGPQVAHLIWETALASK